MNSSRLIVLALAGLFLSASCFGQTSAILPVGFAEDTLLDTGLLTPVSLAFLPDGRLILVEQGPARVLVYSHGGLGVVGQIPQVHVGQESGVLAVAVDPDWPIDPYIYVYFTHVAPGQPRTNKLVRYAVNGDLVHPTSLNLSLGAPYEILGGISATSDTHNGGSIRFGSDGALFLSIGDGGQSCAAQNINDLHGKVLRIRVDHLPASGPNPPPRSQLVPLSGNPFSGPTDEARLVFCYGFRNPFRFHVDSLTNTVFVADVGADAFEELNVSTGGENFGWPWFEGFMPFTGCPGQTLPPTVPPVAVGPHIPEGFSSFVSMAGLYHNPPNAPFAFGPDYEDSLFFSDLSSPAPILRAIFDGQNWVPAPQVPGQNLPAVWGAVSFPVDTVVGPDGALYYLDYFFGRLARIKPTAQALNLTPLGPTTLKGNAGTPTFDSLAVVLTDNLGVPRAGETVSFSVTVGGGTVRQSSVITSASGLAETIFDLPEVFTSQDPVITAFHPLSNSVPFTVKWRGLSVTNNLQLTPPSLVFRVRHSQPNTGVTLAAQVEPVAAPFAQLTAGQLWTSILAPAPGFVIIGDGLGLTGPPNLNYRTGNNSQFLITFGNVPMTGGITLSVQAYAIDSSELYPELVLISNRAIVTIP